MVVMDDLITWLRAQLDEDERIAREAEADNPSPWRLEDDQPYPDVYDAAGHAVVTIESGFNPPTVRVETHIARHDPARVLAEVDAKRRILDLHPPIRRRLWLEVAEESGGGAVSLADLTCSRCFPRGVPVEVGVDPWAPCMTVRLLALPYADRDGYREAWRP